MALRVKPYTNTNAHRGCCPAHSTLFPAFEKAGFGRINLFHVFSPKQQAAAPPKLSTITATSEEGICNLSFSALPQTSLKMPPSCLLPIPPLWMADSMLFYDTVEDHGAASTAPHGGAWWLGGSVSKNVRVCLFNVRSWAL